MCNKMKMIIIMTNFIDAQGEIAVGQLHIDTDATMGLSLTSTALPHLDHQRSTKFTHSLHHLSFQGEVVGRLTSRSGQLRTTSWAQALTSSPLMKERSTPPILSRPEKSGSLCQSSVSSSNTCFLRLACSLRQDTSRFRQTFTHITNDQLWPGLLLYGNYYIY